jgi:pimeloyl-ACP methyl ester carboxylesterase
LEFSSNNNKRNQCQTPRHLIWRLSFAKLEIRGCLGTASRLIMHHHIETKIISIGSRQIAVREFGDPQGYPILFMHGNLNSRLFSPCWETTQDTTHKCGARVFALDRPGVGLSTPHPKRTYADWSHDIDCIADNLNLPSFAVVGYSSGGPHALASAVLCSKVTGCALVSSDAPYADMRDSGYNTFAAKTLEQSLAATQLLEQSLRRAYRSLKPARQALAMQDLDEAIREGFEGPAQDGVLETNPWGFDPSAAMRHPLHMWHGGKDTDVSIEAAKFLRSKVQPHRATFIETETHSMIRRYWPRIIGELIEDINVSSCKL